VGRRIAFYLKSGFREVESAVFLLGTDRQRDRVLITVLGESAVRAT
jgi:hypothetical protein